MKIVRKRPYRVKKEEEEKYIQISLIICILFTQTKKQFAGFIGFCNDFIASALDAVHRSLILFHIDHDSNP